jgi:hypothetical protein
VAGQNHDISQRRACKLIGVDPKTVRRERPQDCHEIRKEMQEIAGKRRRFGYRRIGVLLERKGMTMNHKKLYRIYREEGLSVKRRRGRKRARGSRTPMPEALRPNARWSLDFLADSFGASRKFRILATTPSGRTHRSETRRRCKRAECLSNLRAPPPARLPGATNPATRIQPADSRYERGTSGGQVKIRP